MNRDHIATAVIILAILIGTATFFLPAERPASTFRLLISDHVGIEGHGHVHATGHIGDFDRLDVRFSNATIVHRNGTAWTLDIDQELDLTELPGPHATEVINTPLPPGSYVETRVGIDAVTGTGTNGTVTAPAVLTASHPFRISGHERTDLVFDITVGRTDDRYRLAVNHNDTGIAGEEVEVLEVLDTSQPHH